LCGRSFRAKQSHDAAKSNQTRQHASVAPLIHFRRIIQIMVIVRFFLVACLLLISGCSLPRAYESVLVLQDTAAGGSSSRLKATRPAPNRQPLTYSVDGRTRQAILYTPADRAARAVIVLVPGVVPEGPEETRFSAFALTLARAGFNVLAPEIPNFRQLRIQPGDAEIIADAFRHAVSHPDMAPSGRAGIGAFSYAVGPAMLAALEPDIREQVRFIVGIGGYHDLPRAMRFFTTGWYEHDGRWQAIEPDPYGQLVLVQTALAYLPSRTDHERFVAMIERRLQDRDATIADLADRLSSEGRAVYELATNRDRTRFAELIENLPQAMQRDLAALNLANKDLRSIKAKLILVHGQHDNLIPYPESLALAASVGEDDVRPFIIHRILGHVDLSSAHILRWTFWREDLPDAWRMLRAVYRLLSERDGK
jgi:hypothetical protein